VDVPIIDDEWVEGQVIPKTISGYYEGFTLDFDYSIVYDYDYESIESFIENIREYPEDFGYESQSP